jgi:hypothetical protein
MFKRVPVQTVEQAKAAGHNSVDPNLPWHLTMTGPYAGTPYCTVEKSAALRRGERFSHLPYANVDRFLSRPDICPACRDEFYSCCSE